MNQLCRYDTPRSVATVLARHAPRNVRTILDPCVGSGALVDPLVSRAVSQKADVVCIDIDGQAVESVKRRFEPRLGSRLHVEQADFLSARTTKRLWRFLSSIDCVLMNPPFAGQKRAWRSITVSSRNGQGKRTRFAPAKGGCCLHRHRRPSR